MRTKWLAKEAARLGAWQLVLGKACQVGAWQLMLGKACQVGAWQLMLGKASRVSGGGVAASARQSKQSVRWGRGNS